MDCLRLSVRTDETTSPERQREANARVSAALGISFGEGEQYREAVDLGVSASKIGPFDRPQLGAWLARPDEFDALVWWRFDRAIRSMSDMHELAKWAREHRKMLIFAEGIGGGGMLVFDFRNPMDPMSELMMMMFAFAAQVESQSITDRVTGAQAAMRKMPLRWRGGGKPAYGYLPAPMPRELGGAGWTLVPDPVAVGVIKRILAALVAGLSPLTIARQLNTDGVPSPSAHWAQHKARQKGEEYTAHTTAKRARPAQWRDKTVIRLLTSPAPLGWKQHQGKPVRDDQGAPVLAAATPILTREEFDQAAVLLTPKLVAARPPERPDSGALLLRVAHCAGCKSRMYLNKGYYVCSSYKYGHTCPAASSVRADWIDQHITAEVLRMAGPVEITRVTEIPGYDPAPEIAATVAEMEEHDEQRGRRKSAAGMAAWQRRADALEARLAELETREKTEPRREAVSTGRTYADDWNAADTIGRRTMLVDMGARLEVRRATTRGRQRALDLSRVAFSITGDLDPAIEEAVTVADDVADESRPTVLPTIGAKAHRTLIAA
ncbi:recombinase family protein [Streptomyces sp. NPDC001941]|uniref:recombinase family protein n=1 Tax=Streptomyces sp. NPDC001941 TaxID=3154659 RepID=UPI003326CAFC